MAQRAVDTGRAKPPAACIHMPSTSSAILQLTVHFLRQSSTLIKLRQPKHTVLRLASKRRSMAMRSSPPARALRLSTKSYPQTADGLFNNVLQCHASCTHQMTKTIAQKKRAVDTRPFGREPGFVPHKTC